MSEAGQSHSLNVRSRQMDSRVSSIHWTDSCNDVKADHIMIELPAQLTTGRFAMATWSVLTALIPADRTTPSNCPKNLFYSNQ